MNELNWVFVWKRVRVSPGPRYKKGTLYLCLTINKKRKMKNSIFVLAIAAVALFASCSSNAPAAETTNVDSCAVACDTTCAVATDSVLAVDTTSVN